MAVPFRCQTSGVNEVESTTHKVATRAADEASAAWNRFTGLGLGAGLLTVGLACVGALGLSIAMGQGGATTCDRTFGTVHEVSTYDGNRSLLADVAPLLHMDADVLDKYAARTTGAQRDALTALANDARHARANQPFEVRSDLAAYRRACS